MSKSSTIADLQILVLLPSRRRHFPLHFSSHTAHTNLSGYTDDSLTFEFIGFLLHQNGAEETLVPLNDLVDRFFVSFPFQDPEILPVLISRISPPVWPSASRTASLSLSIVTLTSCSN